METFNIHDAKAHLSRLVDRAANGEPSVIAKAGKPMVKVVPLHGATDRPKSRIGFLKGLYAIPEDIEAFGREEIEEMFHGPKQ